MRKRGKQFNRLSVNPLGVKANTYDLSARSSLVALKNDCANEQHLVNLYVLAELCEKLNESREAFVDSHAASIKRLCDTIHAADYHSGGLATTSMIASVDVLLKWFHKQPNARIAQIAKEEVSKFSKKLSSAECLI